MQTQTSERVDSPKTGPINIFFNNFSNVDCPTPPAMFDNSHITDSRYHNDAQNIELQRAQICFEQAEVDYCNRSYASTPVTKRKRSIKKQRRSLDCSELESKSTLQNETGRPYKCSHCSKSFASNGYLSQHIRIHLRIRPFGPCQYCGKKFTQLSHLQQHVRTHTGDKPYKCTVPGCKKSFTQLSNLQNHSRSHESDKPFKCNSCYKCYASEQDLLAHIPAHKKSKHLRIHVCQYCGKSYALATYLLKHLVKHNEPATKESITSENGPITTKIDMKPVTTFWTSDTIKQTQNNNDVVQLVNLSYKSVANQQKNNDYYHPCQYASSKIIQCFPTVNEPPTMTSPESALPPETAPYIRLPSLTEMHPFSARGYNSYPDNGIRADSASHSYGPMNSQYAQCVSFDDIRYYNNYSS